MNKLLLILSLLLVGNSLFGQNATILDPCNSEEDLKKMKESAYGKDLRYQAQALGLDPEEYVENKIKKLCENNYSEAQSFDFNPIFEISYPEISCDADWNQWCEEKYNIVVPENFQICKLEYHENERGNTTLDIIPSKFINDDKYSGFRSYAIRIRADGNNEFLNRIGAKITVSRFKLLFVPYDFDYQTRKKLGCTLPINTEYQELVPEIPDTDIPPKQLTPEKESSKINSICNLVKYDRTENGQVIYKGINWGRILIICESGSSIVETISPNREYILGSGCGFSCL